MYARILCVYLKCIGPDGRPSRRRYGWREHMGELTVSHQPINRFDLTLT